MLLSMLLVAALIGTNLVLIGHTRQQGRMLAQHAGRLDAIVTADAAVQTFGNLKYWLTDLAVSQLSLSRQRAEASRERLDERLADLERSMPGTLDGVSEQIVELIADASAAIDAYSRDDRLVGNAMMARGRAHILAVDSRLSTLVEQIRSEVQSSADEALAQSERAIGMVMWLVILVSALAVALTLLLVRSVVSRLHEMVGVINAMSAGNMQIPIPRAGRDEIGRMAEVLTLFRDTVLRREQADEMVRRQALIFEQLYDAVIAVDMQDRIVDWNGAAERVFGYTREEMLGQTTDMLYPNPEALSLKREMRELLARGERWVGECDNVRKDGEVVRVEAVVFQLENQRGEPATIVGVSRDVTARQRAEAARRESEARLASIIDHIPATVFLRDLSGTFILVNRHYAEFYELDPDTIGGSANRELFPAGLAAESDDHDREVIEEGRVAEREYTIERSGGTRILWSVKFPIRDQDGTLVALGGVELDITERKRTEELLRAATEAAAAAEARLSDAIEHMSEAIVVYDAEDRLVLCNSRFKEFYQYRDEDVRSGIPYFELAKVDMHRGVVLANDEGAYLRSRREQRQRLQGAVDVQLDGGRWLQIRERMTSAGHIVSIQADVTARKRAEMALLEAKEEAELANQAKSQFLANMSHELRTPLNAIIGITELLEEEAQEDGAERLVEPLRRIHGAGRQLLNLIDEILDLSKIEAGRMELHPTDFSLPRLIEEIATTAQPLAEKNDNALRVLCEAGVGSVHLDETRVRQVILNLVNNACKFSSDGRIEIEVREASQDGRPGVEISVSDEGIGIPSEQVDKLFQPFSQGDSSTSRKYGGTGLGLAISRHFCELLGGKLSVSSEPGRGSTFRVWLPRSYPR